MLDENMSKSDLERELDEKGDFIQIDLINKFLDRSSGLKRDTKKFLFLRLAEIYEKLLEMGLDFQERKEIKEKLLKLYEKLGEIRKYESLKGLK